MKYSSTSVLFYITDNNEHYVLLGEQGHSGTYSDFGGTRKSKMDRNYYDTAFRELLEEWFGWTVIPIHFIDQLINSVEKDAEIHVKNKIHLLFIFSVNEIEKILRLCKNIDRHSAYYKVFPITLRDLIKNRDIRSTKVNQLKIFNIRNDISLFYVDPNAREDIERLRKILDRRIFHQTRS